MTWTTITIEILSLAIIPHQPPWAMLDLHSVAPWIYQACVSLKTCACTFSLPGSFYFYSPEWLAPSHLSRSILKSHFLIMFFSSYSIKNCNPLSKHLLPLSLLYFSPQQSSQIYYLFLNILLFFIIIKILFFNYLSLSGTMSATQVEGIFWSAFFTFIYSASRTMAGK